MVATAKIKPIRRKFVLTLTSFVTFAFACIAYITSNVILTQVEAQVKLDTKERTQFIASRAAPFVESGKRAELKDTLNRLDTIARYNYVHIYNYKTPEQLDFFNSFNREGFPAIADKMSSIDQYKEPQISGEIIEWMTPVNHNGQKIGYIYMQLDVSNYFQLKRKIYIINAIGFILILSLSYGVAHNLHARVLASISKLVDTIRTVSQKRNYQLRCEQMDYLEFELLAKNLNTMLSRTEKYLKKQEDAEQEILKLNHELEDKVSQRTDALKESNQELLSTLEKLHQFQGQLVESEKMASLGDMVAGVAHEVNTPIGLGVTASTLLSDRLNEIKDAFEDKTLKSSQLRKFLNDGQENVGIIYRNLNRAADLISSFKKVAVDQSSEEDRKFAMSELIEEVLLTLAPQLKGKPVDIQIDCPDNLVITSKPGPINQILINLIVNSIVHGFEHKDSGNINIDIMLLSDQLHISYKDNGKGVEKSVKNKIFDPFITTKRGAGGSGLGLHLVYNLVTQALGGNIQFESELGQGVHFEINFPITKNSQIPQ